MAQALKKNLEELVFELRGIKHILGSIWHSRYQSENTDQVSPEVFADEYISTEECARRLAITDQTIRNWILVGRKEPEKGWVQGIHYIMVNPVGKKQIIRIPWNRLILSYCKSEDPTLRTFDSQGRALYGRDREERPVYIPDPTKPRIDMEEEGEEENTDEYQ
jgi:hypothetical protein